MTSLRRLLGPRRTRAQFGATEVVKIGGPAATADLYYTMMDVGWPVFIALVSLAFIGINIVFGLIYMAMPGAIEHVRPGSFDPFFFSVETLATVGYGNMAPATTLGHALAAGEILCGLFFTATVTGLVFARFARPRASIEFSRVAVIGTFDGGRALMVRLASTRTRPIADVSGQLGLLQRITMPDGRTFGRLVDLPLVRPRNPMLNLSWTMIHPLDDDSPIPVALKGDGDITLVATVGGLDTLLATQTFGGHRYTRDDLRIDHEYCDVVRDHQGVFHLDLSMLHETRPSGSGGEGQPS